MTVHPPEEDLLVERKGPVMWVTFNRPRARNALTWNMYDGLKQVADVVSQDHSLVAMVLTGAGGAFAAGTDIALFRGVTTAAAGLAYEARIEAVMKAIETVRVPTIAAVSGSCVGGGAVIAAACDLRIGAPSARLGLPIARSLGNCLSIENSARMVDLLGTSRLKDLMLTGRLMNAEELLHAGVLVEVTHDEDSMRRRAQELAEEIGGSNAPLTVMATKEILQLLRDLRTPVAKSQEWLVKCYASRDFAEGVEAFLTKRRPSWSGK